MVALVSILVSSLKSFVGVGSGCLGGGVVMCVHIRWKLVCRRGTWRRGSTRSASIRKTPFAAWSLMLWINVLSVMGVSRSFCTLLRVGFSLGGLFSCLCVFDSASLRVGLSLAGLFLCLCVFGSCLPGACDPSS